MINPTALNENETQNKMNLAGQFNQVKKKPSGPSLCPLQSQDAKEEVARRVEILEERDNRLRQKTNPNRRGPPPENTNIMD